MARIDPRSSDSGSLWIRVTFIMNDMEIGRLLSETVIGNCLRAILPGTIIAAICK